MESETMRFTQDEIQGIISCIDVGVNEFKRKFPNCYGLAIERNELDSFIIETKQVIIDYEYKISLFGIEQIKLELEEYYLNAQNLISEGIKELREWGITAAYVYLYSGYIELFWIRRFIEILNEKPNQLNPANKENSNSDLHINIFADKGFMFWERLFENFKIKESSQTDIKFCFEKMKKDGFIHQNVRQVDFLEWLNLLKDWDVQKPNSTVNLQDNKRLKLYELTLNSL